MLSEAEEMVCSHPVSQICFSMQAFSGKPAPMFAVKAAMAKEIRKSLCSGCLEPLGWLLMADVSPSSQEPAPLFVICVQTSSP